MCGICGIVYSDQARTVSEQQVVAMRDVLAHRGPDDAGVFLEGPVGIGHRRLSIIDLSARARQPMTSASGRYCLTYNGEIYNFRQLREELEARGHRFISESDTEVLVEGLDEWDIPELLRKLDGIFAFAAWDRHERRLIAAVDPLGVKPFHYAATPQAMHFASELKGLWAAGAPRDVDREALEELLVFRYVAGDATPFSGLKRLPAGHYLVYARGEVTVQCYWSPFDHVAEESAFAATWTERFVRAVGDQRISDVPVGTLLSGGVDSSTVTAELARWNRGEPLHVFTASIPAGEGLDEAPYAEAVARRWNCRYHPVRIEQGDVLARLRIAQSFHDEPLAFGNDLYIYELSRMAKQTVTVLLSGEGADETLGGYVRYQPLRYPWALSLGRSAADSGA